MPLDCVTLCQIQMKTFSFYSIVVDVLSSFICGTSIACHYGAVLIYSVDFVCKLYTMSVYTTRIWITISLPWGMGLF